MEGPERFAPTPGFHCGPRVVHLGSPMKIATWNVNSVKARKDRLLAWLERSAPDVACLQETKVTDDKFPHEDVEAAGYHAAVHGQKTYNGVAILSRSEPAEIVFGMDHGDDDQARLISAKIDGVWIVDAYFPNGGRLGSDKYEYKLEWMRRLRDWLDGRFDPGEPLALCGDFNVAPDDLDVHMPAAWANTVLCHDDVREALERIRQFGLVDVFRKHNPEGHVYSWWDYRQGAFRKNEGLRIDHVFATEPLAERSVGAAVDRDERKGKGASDHAPVEVELE